MGYVTCGRHNRRCCWACDRCPSCEPETGRLLRGDYCKSCTTELKIRGFVWSDYHQNWVTPEVKATTDNPSQNNLFDGSKAQ